MDVKEPMLPWRVLEDSPTFCLQFPLDTDSFSFSVLICGVPLLPAVNSCCAAPHNSMVGLVIFLQIIYRAP